MCEVCGLSWLQEDAYVRGSIDRRCVNVGWVCVLIQASRFMRALYASNSNSETAGTASLVRCVGERQSPLPVLLLGTEYWVITPKLHA